MDAPVAGAEKKRSKTFAGGLISLAKRYASEGVDAWGAIWKSFGNCRIKRH